MTIRPTAQLLDAICRYRSGDAAAFDIIYNESVKYITKCVLNVLNRTAPDASADLQQDIIQDTYLTIAAKLDTLENPEAFFQWAGQIATHHAQRTWNKNLHQQQTEHAGDEQLPDLADDAFIPEDILENKEKQQLIRKMLDELPLNQYLCVVEYFYNGLKEAEVAEKMGMPLNTVKTNLSRAKKKLRSAVETTEKKHGIKLYSLGGMLIFLFQAELLEMQLDLQVQQGTLDSIRVALDPAAAPNTAVGAADSVSSASSSSSASASASSAAAAKTGTAGTLGSKILSFLFAVALLIGVVISKNKPEESLNSDTTPEPVITVAPTEFTAATEPTDIPTGTLSFRPEADVGAFPVPYTVTLTNNETQEVHILEVGSNDTVSVTLDMGSYDLLLESKIGTLYRHDIDINGNRNTNLSNLCLQVPPIFLSPEELAYLEKVTSEALLGAVPDGYVPYINPLSRNPNFSGGTGIPYAMEHVLIGCAGPGGLLPGVRNADGSVTVSTQDAREFLLNVFGYAPQWDNWYNDVTVPGDGTIRFRSAFGDQTPKCGLLNVEYLDYRTIRVTTARQDLRMINTTVLQQDPSSIYGWRILEIRAVDEKVSDIDTMCSTLRKNGAHAVPAGQRMITVPGSLTEEGAIAVARAHWFRETGAVPERIELLTVCLHGNSNMMYVFCYYDRDGNEVDRVAVNEWDGLIHEPCSYLYTP